MCFSSEDYFGVQNENTFRIRMLAMLRDYDIDIRLFLVPDGATFHVFSGGLDRVLLNYFEPKSTVLRYICES